MVSDRISVRQYFFPVVDIRANAKHKPNEEKKLLFDVEAAAIKLPEANDYQLILDIKINEDDSVNHSYTGHTQVVGFFTLNNELTKNESKRLVHKKGMGVLYSAAREVMLMVSSRGPWGAIGLPIVDDFSTIEIQEIDPSQPPETDE